MWPLRVYNHKKRAGQRLNLTPTPDLRLPTKTEASSALGGRKRPGKEQGLPRIGEKVEQSCSGLARDQVGEESLRERSTTSEETQDEKGPPGSESVTDDFQVDSSSSGSELVSGLSLPYDISNSLLSYSVTESSTESKSTEENISSFSSPELFRGSDCLDWECPKLEDYLQCKNSTLLDTSKAVAVEKVPQFSNFSSILGTSSESYQKYHRKIVMTLTDQNISPEPKCTSNSASDNETCEVLLPEETCPSTLKKTKKKPEKESEDRDTNVQTKLNSQPVKVRVPLPHQRSALESTAGLSVTKALPSLPLEPAWQTNFGVPGTKIRGLLTSTPASETADFVIDLSSVQKTTFEELFSNVSNYVNSNEIVPVSSLQENSSKEFPSNASEICCIIRASPGTRQMKSKGDIIKKKKYSPPKDIPPDIIMKNGNI